MPKELDSTRHHARASLLANKKVFEFLVFWFKKESCVSQILLKLWLIYW